MSFAREVIGLSSPPPSSSGKSKLLFFTLNREDFSFVIHLDRQPRTSRRREAQTGSRARSGSRSERTLDAVEHSRTLMEWWPFLIFHRGGLRIKVINNSNTAISPSHRPARSLLNLPGCTPKIDPPCLARVLLEPALRSGCRFYLKSPILSRALFGKKGAL